MLLSILVPVYNVEKYIGKCIDSLLVQTGMPFEIVLLDDGSTDSSGSICDAYAVQHPKLIRVIHKENEGLLLTRRRGFQEAKGDWVACVDSDDYVKPNYLQTIAEAIAQYDCDMFLFDYESFYPDGHTEASGIEFHEIQTFVGDDRTRIYEKRLLKNKYNNMWSKVVRRSVIDLDFDYSVYGVKNMCEDAIQSYALYTRANRIIFLPKVLYCYRRSIQSITAQVDLPYWYALRVGYELGWDYIDRWQMSPDVIHAYASRCISYYCDFTRWIFRKSSISSSEDKDSLIRQYMLENPYFQRAVREYRKELLATRYLKLRNPRLIHYLTSGSPTYKRARLLLSLEAGLQKLLAHSPNK